MMSITAMKKLRRSEQGVCGNCGKKCCLCKIPKSIARRSNGRYGLPVGMTRRGRQG